jgi:DNA-binding LacI/PurR family transcriptional regulator
VTVNRVTINEIARRSGVSKGAVSYALNGRPGVSDRTRARILGIARELGWAPNRTARLLSGSRTDTFGLILARDARTLGSEPFYMEFVAGLIDTLTSRSYGLLLQVAGCLEEELALYPKWASERRVDGVVVVDVRVEDARIETLRAAQIPAVFVGDPSMTGGYTTVWTDDVAAMDVAVEHLAGLGHRRLVRIAGVRDFGHVVIRDDAFRRAVARHGVTGEIVHADFTEQAGRHATWRAMELDPTPTGMLFDNDLMAIAALSTLAEMGVGVPDEVSLIAWDDSALCEITHPELSAMSHDVMAFGAHVGRRLFEVLDGHEPAAHLDSTPHLVRRGSTAPPRPTAD